jgi:hypothetical protein
MNAPLGRKMRTTLIAIGAAVENVEAGRSDPAERECLACACDALARALRAADARAIDSEVIEVIEQ